MPKHRVKDRVAKDAQVIKYLIDEGTSYTKLARSYGISRTTMRRYLIDLGIYERRSGLSSKVNHSSLDYLTDDSKFAIGVIARKGHIERDRNKITVYSTNTECLEKLSALFSSRKGSIRIHDKGSTMFINFTSKRVIGMIDYYINSGELRSGIRFDPSFWSGVVSCSNPVYNASSGYGVNGIRSLSLPNQLADAYVRLLDRLEVPSYHIDSRQWFYKPDYTDFMMLSESSQRLIYYFIKQD